MDNLGKTSEIQLVLNQPDDEEDMINFGRVFHNMKLKSRVFVWILVLCMLVGICAPLLLYQIQTPELIVASVVTLRYNDPVTNEPVSTLVAPDGSVLDLLMVSSAPVIQKALDGITLSKHVTVENIRNNLTVTRVLTDESSRTREILAGLADTNNAEVYERLENTELIYKNRFIVTLTNGFRDEEDDPKVELKDDELHLLLNRILDAYNDVLIRQYADLRLPEDWIAMIDMETQDLPEVLDSLSTALDELYNYCDEKPVDVRAYRSWQTGMSLDDWMTSIQTLRDVSVNYLDADIYARGLMRDRDAVELTFRYRLRTLQSELDKTNETITKTEEQLNSYKNDIVYVGMQESDSVRSTTMTTNYYNQLVLQQQNNYRRANELRTEIAETQNKLERLEKTVARSEIATAVSETESAIALVRQIQDDVRNHMMELFASPLYTTYSEHSAPQGELPNFLKASAKKVIIGAVAGALLACGLWFMAALIPEFQREQESAKVSTKAKTGKEDEKA